MDKQHAHRYSDAPAILLAAAVGFMAWGHGLTALAAAFPLAWSLATTRYGAFGAALAYYLAGARAVPDSAAVFFGDPNTSWLAGALIWVLSSTLFALPWGLLKAGGSTNKRLASTVAALAAITVPPLGWIAWLNPLLGAALLLPGAGAISLAIGVAALLVANEAIHLVPRYRYWVACTLSALLYAHAQFSPPEVPTNQNWYGAQTEDGQEPHGLTQEIVRYSRTEEVVRKALATPSAPRVVVLPEQYVGTWNRNAHRALASLLTQPLLDHETTVILGTAIPIEGTKDTTNSALIFDGKTWRHHEARFAVPFSMWHPWRPGGTRPTYRIGSVVTVAGKRAYLSMCYEDFMLGMHLPDLVMGNADLIVSMANGWWVRSSSAQRVQEEHIRATAAIFGLPLVRALNRG